MTDEEEFEKNTKGITAAKTFKLTYYDYGQPFYGSYKGMRYRIARNPLVNVYGKSQEIKEDGRLVATFWPGPSAFEFVKEEELVSMDFPYTSEGKTEAIAWLNEQYELHKDRFQKIYQMFR